MAQKKAKPKAPEVRPKPTTAAPVSTETPAWLPYLLAAAALILYWFYSGISTGFYQHDEIGHFFNMLAFWDDPAQIMGNWPKTGYKIIYVLPALLGSKFLLVLNSLLSALTALLAYHCAKLLKLTNPLLVFFLVALQPFWIELSFRNYADSFSGIVLLLGVFFMIREKWLFAALVLSFSTIVRQEFFLVAGPLGLFWLLQRKWIPAFTLALFPVLYNLAGFALFGDPIYLFTSVTETSGLYADVFGKHGFFHFFRMSIVVFGAVVPVLFAGGLAWLLVKFTQTRKWDIAPFAVWFGFFAVSVYFILHGLFNVPGLNLAASPNLRYMNAIGPTAALLGCWFLHQWQASMEKPKWFLGFSAVMVLLLAVYSSFKNNGVVFSEEKDWLPVLLFIASLAVLYLLKGTNAMLAYIAIAAISGFYLLQPRKLTPEELAMKNITQSVIENKAADAPVFTNHMMYRYWYEKANGKAPKNVLGHDSTSILNAPSGTAVVWETHYSNRKDFPSVSFEFLANNQQQFGAVNQIVSTDQRFQAIVFIKK